MFQFYKGRTNNHLTWVMVDATDFATPESALSAATKIKIYGKLRGATGVNFVSSGTGSLTNDIQHVGASALGIYTIALAKADLSDASAAWYDQYVVSLSATGAAYQTLIADGGIDHSALSAYQSRLSDLASYLVAMSGMLSDTHSAAILGASNASEAQSQATLAASRILLVQSRLSDFNSVYTSDISDLRSYLSDIHSDLKSALGDVSVTITASDISDIASAVAAATGSVTSDIYSLLSSLNSEFLSRVPKAVATASVLSDFYSDFGSRVPKRVATDSQLSDLHSDLRSHVTAAGPTASDLASVFITEFGGDMSDIRSALAAGVALDASTMSDIRSAVTAITATVSASDMSDIRSSILSLSGMLSDAHSAAAQANSRVLLNQSRISDLQSALVVENSRLSDIYSLLSDLHSDVGVISGVVSDVYSAVTAAIGASDLSDIASAVWARAGADPTAVVGATGTMGAKVDFITAMARNKILQNSAVLSLRNDADSADICSAAVSDDGTTFTRGEFA